MLKKVMTAFMALCLLERGIGLVYLLIHVHTVLPNGVLGCTALICGVFASLLFFRFFGEIKRRDMEFAFLLNCIIVIYNMTAIRYGVPSTLNVFEYLAAGNLFEVLAGMVFIILSRQRTSLLVAQQEL